MKIHDTLLAAYTMLHLLIGCSSCDESICLVSIALDYLCSEHQAFSHAWPSKRLDAMMSLSSDVKNE